MPSPLALLDGTWEWILFFFCAMLIGISKTGVQNVGTFAIPVFALLFGAKDSTGIILPLLCFADTIAVIYYRKKFHLSYILKLLPWAIAGLVIALVLGHWVSESGFKTIMGCCILLGVAVMLWLTRANKIEPITSSVWFAPLFGFTVGFSTMIGNAAGPILTVYLLAMRLPKYVFVATGAWFIMILNFLKIPLQVFVWDNITMAGFLLGLLALPFIILGGIIGIRVVHVLPEKQFKTLMVTLIIGSTLFLLI